MIVSRSLREDCDVEFLVGAVAIAAPLIDWSGNCGSLSAAVGPFAIARDWVPTAQRSSAGVDIDKHRIDVLARIGSMGKLHHAFTGTGSIALAVAAALPGTVVSELARTLPGVPTRIGHASGVMAVGAALEREGNTWRVDRAVMSRSARRLMEGTAFVP